jgi:septal ring-binding cell division protein DamX
MNSLGLLALALALMDVSDDRIVCVPASDGDGWECGKGDQAPAARSLPHAQPAAPPVPPPYLIDPSQMPSVMIEAAPVSPPAATATPEPAPAPPPTPAVHVAPEPAPEPVPAPGPALTTAPVPAAEPVATPEPVVVPGPAPTPEPASAPEATPPPGPAPVARIISSAARDAADLLALPGSGYTVQLAATRGIQGFTALRQKLDIAVEDTFVIRVRRGNEDWWLMLWRDFPDLDSARRAAATLSAHGNFWPRRLAPLQGEVRATPD